MKKLRILLMIIGVFFLFGKAEYIQAANVPLTLESGVYRYESAAQVLELINAQRRAAGIRELTGDSEMEEAAMLRAAELHFYYSHVRPNGTSYQTICESKKITGEIVGVKEASGDAAGIVDSWVKNSGNARHVLYEKYVSAGVGSFTQGGYTYWVVLFGSEQGNGAGGKQNQKVSPQITADTGLLELKYVNMGKSFRSGKTNKFQVASVNQGFPSDSVSLAAGNFRWSYSNPSAITLYTNGTAIFNKGGKTTVTAALKASPTVKLSKEITAVLDISSLELPQISDVMYNGKAQKPVVSLSYRNQSLKKNRDFKVTYTNNKSVGTARILIKGTGNFTGAKSVNFRIVPKFSRPSAPSLEIDKISYNKVKLTWNKVSNATGYVVYRKEKGEKYEAIKTLPAGKRSFTDKKVVFQQEYKYMVRAYRKSGTAILYSKNSKSFWVTPDHESPQLEIRAKAGKHILTWDSVSGIDGYILYRKEVGNPYQAEALLTADRIRYTIGTEEGKTYKYKLVPYYRAGGEVRKCPASKVIKIKGQ